MCRISSFGIRPIFMSMSTNFCRLRQEVWISIVTMWLELKDVVRVDSAICKQPDRTIWLALLASRKCKFSLTSRALIRREFISWQLSRYVHFQKITLIGHLLEERDAITTSDSSGIFAGENMLPQCIEQFCCNITALELKDCILKEYMWDMLLASPHLTSLRIVGTVVESNQEPKPSMFPNMTRLFIDMHYFTATNLVSFVQQFPALTSLHFSGTFYNEYFQLPETCPHLIHLCLRDTCLTTNQIIKLMGLLGKGLKCLALPDCHRLCPSTLTALSHHTHTLRCLHMTGKFPSVGDASKVALALNECKVLETLYVHASVVATDIVRIPSVRVLHLEYCTCLALDKVTSSCRSIDTLGILSTSMPNEKFVTNVAVWLFLHPRVSTVHVMEELCVPLRAMLPHRRSVLVQKNTNFDISLYGIG